MEQLQILRTFFIPFQGGQAVLPQNAVMEVLPFATPLIMANTPPWVIGAMLWRSFTMPLVSLDRLVHRTNHGPGTQSRIVVINALGSDPKLPNFGVVAAEVPRPMSLERTDIIPDEAAEPMPSVLAQAKVNGRPIIIPDLDAIESALSQLVRPIAS